MRIIYCKCGKLIGILYNDGWILIGNILVKFEKIICMECENEIAVTKIGGKCTIEEKTQNKSN